MKTFFYYCLVTEEIRIDSYKYIDYHAVAINRIR